MTQDFVEDVGTRAPCLLCIGSCCPLGGPDSPAGKGGACQGSVLGDGWTGGLARLCSRPAVLRGQASLIPGPSSTRRGCLWFLWLASQQLGTRWGGTCLTQALPSALALFRSLPILDDFLVTSWLAYVPCGRRRQEERRNFLAPSWTESCPGSFFGFNLLCSL